MRKSLRVIGLVALCAWLAPFALRAQSETMALRGARLITISHGEMETGIVVFRGGEIMAVGSDISIPSGARVIDVPGTTVMPGLIDGFTNLGLADYPSYGEDDDEATGAVTPQMQVIDALNPDNRFFRYALSSGVTTALCAPAEGNLVSGRSALIRTDGSTVSEMVLAAPAGVHVTLGEAPKLRYGEKNQMPMTRMGSAALLRQTLIKAQEYAAKLTRHQEEQASRDRRDGNSPTPPARDLKLEALLPVLSGELPLIVSADRFDDIHTALRIADEFGLPLVLNRGAEAHRVAERLAESGVAVIWGPAHARYGELEARRGSARTPAILAEAGVMIAFQTGGVVNVTGLLDQARHAVANGLARAEALKALTAYPAEIFGVADRLGSLEVGKRADLIVFDGDPLEGLSKVELVFVSGRQVFAGH